MGFFSALKFRLTSALLVLLFLLFAPNLWAIQEAIVTADKALVYADELMTSPVGFVRRGKKIKVGDIARNKAQVYPIMVSGKVAFIRVIDVSTEKEAVDSSRLVAERFHKAARSNREAAYGLYLMTYSSQISLSCTANSADTTLLQDNDSLNWTGFGFKGMIFYKNKTDLSFGFNWIQAEKGKEEFRVLETGINGGYRVFEKGSLLTRIFAEFMLIPFASYALDPDFRINGYGFSAGTGVGLMWRLGERFALEGSAGMSYMRLMGLNSPSPYKAIEPAFIGARLMVGLNYFY